MSLSVNFPYEIIIPKESQKEFIKMKSWCKKNIGVKWSANSYQSPNGNRTGTWTVTWCALSDFYVDPWSIDNHKWSFMNEKDMILFTLKWL